MILNRSIFLWATILFYTIAINAQGDYLKKYFPKEEKNIVKLYELAYQGDSSAFFKFANSYKAKAISQKNFELVCVINDKYAIYYYLKGEFNICFKYYDSSIALIEKEKLPEYNYHSVFNNRGTIKYQAQLFVEAIKDFKREEELMMKYKIGNLEGLYTNMASLYIMANDPINGKKYIFKALPFVKLKKDLKAYADLLKSLASVNYSEKNFVKGDSVMLAAIKITQENNLKTDYAECLYEYCNSLKSQDKLAETKSFFEELVVLTSEIKDTDWNKQVTLELARVNLVLGNKTEAKKLLLAAEKIVPSKSMPNIEKLDVYKNSAYVYHSLGMYQKASEVFLKHMVLESAEKAKNEVGKLNEVSYAYEKKQDSLNVVRDKELAELENLRMQEKAQHKLHQQRVIIIVSLIGFVLIIGFSISLIRANRNKEKANKEISYQKGLLFEKNKEITDSITYAKHIQHSLLPLPDYIDILLPQHFLLYLPKDIVSGDFYWMKQINANELFVAVADCTGHGVPGAMMSALSIQNLNELASQTRSPSKLLGLLNFNLKNTLNQEQEGFSKDGLDICLCKINVKEKKLIYSGANRSLQIFTETGLKQEIKATKTGIGGHTNINQEYAEHEVILEKNELIVMSTDGFADQFGGNENKKITTKRFKKWITEIFSEESKKEALEKKYTDWKGNNDQIDDVCVLGFKI